ncbi:ATP-binding protein [Microvirga sp. 0TCS3.31]
MNSQDRLPPHILMAEYAPATLPEDAGNPLIEALPKHPEISALRAAFGRYPLISGAERNLPNSVRLETISRISNYLEPLPSHFEVAEKISLNIRAGYRYRNPAKETFRRDQVRFYREAMAGKVQPILHSGPSTAPSFALFGISGVGKSTVVERMLTFLPQVLCHRDHQFVQIVWIKIDCPTDGSLKQLLFGILAKIDGLLGTGYSHAKRRTEIEALKIDIGCIAHTHHVGALVIDEIGNLIDAPGGGGKRLQRFLVSFANEVKIPLVVVGTTRAISQLQGIFCQARRTSNNGVHIWEPMRQGTELWEFFLEGLFKYQWTKHPVAVNREIADLLHELTQGIHGLVVCLFQLAQQEAISTGAECLSEALFKKVASEQFKLVQPMLNAIKSGNATLINRYEEMMIATLDTLKSKVEEAGHLALLKEQARGRQQCAAERIRTISALIAMGYTDEDVRPFVDKYFDENPNTSSTVVVREILSSMEDPSMHQDGLNAESLRTIVDESAARGVSALDALSAAGIVTEPHGR